MAGNGEKISTNHVKQYVAQELEGGQEISVEMLTDALSDDFTEMHVKRAIKALVDEGSAVLSSNGGRMTKNSVIRLRTVEEQASAYEMKAMVLKAQHKYEDCDWLKIEQCGDEVGLWIKVTPQNFDKAVGKISEIYQ